MASEEQGVRVVWLDDEEAELYTEPPPFEGLNADKPYLLLPIEPDGVRIGPFCIGFDGWVSNSCGRAWPVVSAIEQTLRRAARQATEEGRE